MPASISTPVCDYLVDTLALTDLSRLAPVFANPTQRKIFHACEYDLICLKRDFHFEVNTLFDTMLAARILGKKLVGLGNLLQENFEIELDKRYQRANWGIRPLSPEMLDYARMDTHHLFRLQELLEDELKAANLWELALEDFNLFSRIEPHSVETSGLSCWKAAGAARITPRQAAILHELCHYRDQQARKMDLPHFKVLSNDLLLELCLETPHTLEELAAVPGVTDRLKQRHGAGILSAVEHGEKAKPITREPRTPAEPRFLKRLDNLRKWRKELAARLEVESDVVLPRDFMERIATDSPKTRDRLAEIMADIPWRYRQYGQSILDVLNKEI